MRARFTRYQVCPFPTDDRNIIVHAAPERSLPVEIELKFFVPLEKRAALLNALRSGDMQSRRLRDVYYDTKDGTLAGLGITVRLRKEGKRWIQTAKMDTPDPLLRLEHNVDVPTPQHQEIPELTLARHDGSAVGAAISKALQHISPQQRKLALNDRFHIDVLRRIRTEYLGDSKVELAFDTGNICCGERSIPICEFEMELKSGAIENLFRLAEVWAIRTGLHIYTPSKAARAGYLIDDRKGAYPLTAVNRKITRHEGKSRFLVLTLQNCLTQIMGNVSEISSGSRDEEFVHQLRIGLRRIRTALRELSKFSTDIDPAWESAFSQTFHDLGTHRDMMVVLPEVIEEMHFCGIDYAWKAPTGLDSGSPQLIVHVVQFQRAMLSVLAYCHITLRDEEHQKHAHSILKKKMVSLLDKLHLQIAVDARHFSTLTTARRHGLRKRLKRLRYLSEFSASLFDSRRVKRYLNGWRKAQDCLGTYNDYRISFDTFHDDTRILRNRKLVLNWLDTHLDNCIMQCAETLRLAANRPVFW
jgi:triphosphatase